MQEIKIRIDDTYMPVIIFGNGRKNLVMLSGLSVCGLEGKGAEIAEEYKQFHDEFTVYVFDRRKLLHKGATTIQMAEDVVSTLKTLCVESASFYGVSHGGLMAVYIAEKYPEMVENLILGASAPKSTETLKKAMGEMKKLADEKDVVGLNRCFFKRVYTPAYLEKFKDKLPVLEKEGTAADCERLSILAYACANSDFEKDLDKIKCRIFAFVGKDDCVMGTAGCDMIKNACKGSKVIYIKNYGHAIYDELPDIKQMVCDFIMNMDTDEEGN